MVQLSHSFLLNLLNVEMKTEILLGRVDYCCSCCMDSRCIPLYFWFGRRRVRTCIWALCYNLLLACCASTLDIQSVRHRQNADLEKFSKVAFSKGSALHESCMPGVKLL